MFEPTTAQVIILTVLIGVLGLWWSLRSEAATKSERESTSLPSPSPDCLPAAVGVRRFI